MNLPNDQAHPDDDIPFGACRRWSSRLRRDSGLAAIESLATSSQRLGDLLAASTPSPSQRAIQHEQELRLADVLSRISHDSTLVTRRVSEDRA
jgi:hypothetical protein